MSKEYFHLSFTDVKLRNKRTMAGKKSHYYGIKNHTKLPEIYVPDYLALYNLYSLFCQSDLWSDTHTRKVMLGGGSLRPWY